ncbi:hypothetical protein QQ045_011223 [Rhodiola kirilowii]
MGGLLPPSLGIMSQLISLFAFNHFLHQIFNIFPYLHPSQLPYLCTKQYTSTGNWFFVLRKKANRSPGHLQRSSPLQSSSHSESRMLQLKGVSTHAPADTSSLQDLFLEELMM